MHGKRLFYAGMAAGPVKLETVRSRRSLCRLKFGLRMSASVLMQEGFARVANFCSLPKGGLGAPRGTDFVSQLKLAL